MAMRGLAQRTWSHGGTDLQRALRELLKQQLQQPSPGGGGGENHCMLVTDGVPTAGEPLLLHEREVARNLGLTIHTVFVGGEHEPYPPPLAALAAATGGLRFQARVAAGSVTEVRPSWWRGSLGWEVHSSSRSAAVSLTSIR